MSTHPFPLLLEIHQPDSRTKFLFLDLYQMGSAIKKCYFENINPLYMIKVQSIWTIYTFNCYFTV